MIVGRGIRLMVPGDAPAGDAVVWFSSEDVTITGVEPIEWTHNVLPGAIASVHPARRRTEVVTDAGVEISALVTRQSERELELARGLSVFALIETGSVRVLERYSIRGGYPAKIAVQTLIRSILGSYMGRRETTAG